MAIKLTTKERVKSRLSLSSDQNKFDALLDRLIESASGYVATLLSFEIENAERTEYYQYNKSITLRNAPITAITSVEIDVGTLTTPNLKDLDYRADNRLGILYLGDNYTSELPNAVKVVYTAGYVIDIGEEANTLPVQLTEVVERMVARLFKRREDEGRLSETFEGATIAWDQIIDKVDNKIINGYKRLWQSN